MRIGAIFKSIFVVFFFYSLTSYQILEKRGCDHEIAISFDDAPMPGTSIFSGVERTEEIIKKLEEVNAPAVGIFALGIHAQREFGIERLKKYAIAGHILANHSYSHYRLGEVEAETFIEDIKRAHVLLSDLPNFRLFFRFPYLYEGDNTTQRKEVLKALADMGYREGYVTVSNFDFYINYLAVQAVKEGKKINYEKLKEIYIKILWECIDFHAEWAHKILGRAVKHVLLLHENDLAALFIGDLISLIRSKGWKIISIEDAYKDPIATIPLTTIYGYSTRIFAIGKERGLRKQEFSHFPSSCECIKKMLEEENVFF
ncbi:MAG: polysaccharide deacetylase family protein [Cytophagales bacterium]|nr:polysaccharide deacetylase family protein [Cytophagales bacterium]